MASRLALALLASIGAVLASETRGQATDWPWLGVLISDITAVEAQGLGSSEGGALVTSVEHASAALAAGIRRYDLIIAIDGQTAANTRELMCLIQSRQPGDVVRVTVVRAGKRQAIAAQLGRWPDVKDVPPPRRGDCGRDKVSAR